MPAVCAWLTDKDVAWVDGGTAGGRGASSASLLPRTPPQASVQSFARLGAREVRTFVRGPSTSGTLSRIAASARRDTAMPTHASSEISSGFTALLIPGYNLRSMPGEMGEGVVSLGGTFGREG